MSDAAPKLLVPGAREIVSPGKKEVRFATFVVWRCDGDDPMTDEWTPVLPEDVPAWLRHPDVLGRLADEQTIAKDPASETGDAWFRVEMKGVLDS